MSDDVKGPDEAQHVRQEAQEGSKKSPTGDDLDHETRAGLVKGPAETEER